MGSNFHCFVVHCWWISMDSTIALLQWRQPCFITNWKNNNGQEWLNNSTDLEKEPFQFHMNQLLIVKKALRTSFDRGESCLIEKYSDSGVLSRSPQTRNVLSELPDTMKLPLGSNTTACTASSWPLNSATGTTSELIWKLQSTSDLTIYGSCYPNPLTYARYMLRIN